MKIALFSNSDLCELENVVNGLIASVNVIDIKISAYSDGTDILVIYDEIKGAE